MDAALKELRISSTIDAVSGSTKADFPKLVYSGMRPLPDCDESGQVFAVDAKTGRPRFGKHGKIIDAYELAQILKADPRFAPAWGSGRVRR
jgi:hypothetical protein